MAGKRLDTMDLRNLIRYIRAGGSNRQVGLDTGIDRRTVGRYRKWADEQGLLSMEQLPSLEEFAELVRRTLPPAHPLPQSTSGVEPYRELVEQLYRQQVGGTAICQRLHERGYTGTVSSVYRFLKQLNKQSGADQHQMEKRATVRVERPPGEEAQVDFGYVGQLIDPDSGKLRKAFVFVMTLAYSRHMYIEFVWHLDLASWLSLHRRAFEFFGGVVQRVVLDNLKAGVIKTSFDGTDPTLQPAYQECAEHYGFLVAPCRPYQPEHKGKVEANINYVKVNLLAGQPALSLPQANAAGRKWCLETAGRRIHGTTKRAPLAVFEAEEKKVLLPLPHQPYELAVWKEVKVHRDCHVVFEGSFYSVPFRLIGAKVRVKATSRSVKIYTPSYEAIATHSRATAPGQRLTHDDHLPPTKVGALRQTRSSVLEAATAIGPATTSLVEKLLEEKPRDMLMAAGKLVRLANRAEIGPARLEAACKRALRYDEISYRAVKNILTSRLEQTETELSQTAGECTTSLAPPGASSELVAAAAPRFSRSAEELVGHLFRASALVVSSAAGVVSQALLGGGGWGWN